MAYPGSLWRGTQVAGSGSWGSGRAGPGTKPEARVAIGGPAAATGRLGWQ